MLEFSSVWIVLDGCSTGSLSRDNLKEPGTGASHFSGCSDHEPPTTNHQPPTTNHEPLTTNPLSCGLQRIRHQHCDRERTDSARDRRERPGHFLDLRMHIADEDGALGLKERQPFVSGGIES